MQRITLVALAIVLGGAVGCTVSTPGQGVAHNDAEYCAMLVDMYSRYMAGDEFGQRQVAGDSNLEGRVAVAKCRAGDTAAGIPVLERKLVAGGFTLPRRS